MRSFPEARRMVTLSGAATDLFVARSLLFCFLAWAAWFSICPVSASAQVGSQQVGAQQIGAQQIGVQESPATNSASQSETKQNSAELASHDEPATFKVNVKLVVVRAVVRDPQGHAIGNLRQDDFQVFDKGKPQVITQFEVEQPGTLAARVRQQSIENSGEIPSADTSPSTGNVPAVPERFVAYLFDDVHLEFGDLARVREAAERHFAQLRPTDRAAIFSTSGQTTLEFTDDHAQLHATLLRLQPRPIARAFGHDCPDISYYQADLILNKNDPQATQVAIQDAIACSPPPPNNSAAAALQMATALVQGTSASVLSAGDHESRIALGLLSDVVRNVSRKPGQRSVVLVSPGFITPQLEYDYTQIIDSALRSQVVINTLDARGLYVPSSAADASISTPPPAGKALLEIAAASAQDDLLAVLADGTGGVFFHNNNDLDEGFRHVAETPEYSYVLAFVPQNLKLDGSFHSLKVTLKNPQKLSLQARRGYYAPKNFTSPDEQAKQEIVDAMYSQEELHNLPVNLHTQFFKASDQDATLVVLAHVDVKRLRFRKVEGRNNNVLTCVSALFNRNGNFVEGIEKTVTMKLKDETLERKLGSGITLKTSFDVKPGSYLVRLVVRDAEGQMMSAENGTVEIR
ncbi:MAG: VWA domain-containing protein [Candidatus Sulfotelmatobacter sp.]